jgi:hypothetical protein
MYKGRHDVEVVSDVEKSLRCELHKYILGNADLLGDRDSISGGGKILAGCVGQFPSSRRRRGAHRSNTAHVQMTELKDKNNPQSRNGDHLDCRSFHLAQLVQEDSLHDSQVHIHRGDEDVSAKIDDGEPWGGIQDI